MAGQLDGRRAIVTGAGRGMGRTIAQAFAAEGAHVLLISRSQAPLSEACEQIRRTGGRADALAADLADLDGIPELAERAIALLGGADILVNNAGISGAEAPFLTMSPVEWRRMLAVNLDAPMLLSQQIARSMAARGTGGVILHNASIAGLATDGPYAHYSVSKAALLALTRSMAVELAGHSIRVNAVSPGYTKTEMTTGVVSPAQEQYMATAFDRVPLRRLVTPEEVAQTFLFLASPAASGITGANIVVDGGLTANLYILETLPKA